MITCSYTYVGVVHMLVTSQSKVFVEVDNRVRFPSLLVVPIGDDYLLSTYSTMCTAI